LITRLYANNYRCLVAFEGQFDALTVLCGANGAGKSSIFDAVRVLRDLALGDITTEQAVRYDDHTSWLDSNVTEFELHLDVQGRAFSYQVHIEQVSPTLAPRITKENAVCENKTLFERDLDGVRFDKASGLKTGFPLDWRKAALGSIQPANDRRDIETLQEALGKILILRPNPLGIEAESKDERSRPSLDLANLTSWFRSLSQEQEWTDLLREGLRDVWSDFKSFRLVNTGLQAKELQLRFDSSGRSGDLTLTMDQLSDGEKMLIGLHMMRTALATGAVNTLLVDEPDNFIGLPELQPWILSLMELTGGAQAMVISHSAEILNASAEQFGRYLWRDNHTSLTRIGPLRTPEGLSVGEAIARGWAHA